MAHEMDDSTRKAKHDHSTMFMFSLSSMTVLFRNYPFMMNFSPLFILHNISPRSLQVYIGEESYIIVQALHTSHWALSKAMAIKGERGMMAMHCLIFSRYQLSRILYKRNTQI